MTHTERFRQLFRGRENCHGQFEIAEDKRPRTVRGPAPDTAWDTHLQGVGPYLGIVPVMQDLGCYFGAIDIDDDDTDHLALAEKVQQAKLPLITCRSKSGGAHLYVFTLEPVPAKTLANKLKAWAAVLGYTRNKKDDRPIEVFPKQAKLDADALGNWINLPYYGGDQTNRYAIVSGKPASLEEFLTAAEAARVSLAMLNALGAAKATTPEPEYDPTKPFAAGPPCLQRLHADGFDEGGRNNGLYNICVFFKLAYPSRWQDLSQQYADTFDPPLPDAEVKGTIKSASSKDYCYTCDQLPIAPVCDKRGCEPLPFGFTAFRRKKLAAALPRLSGLTKILTDPPLWELTVDDTTVRLDTDDLLMIARFTKVVAERCNVLMPILKMHEWRDQVVALMEHVVEVDASEGAGVSGQFRFLLDEFLKRRAHAKSLDDLLRGLPVEKDGRVYFRSGDLVGFLAQRNFYDYKPREIYVAIKDLGGEHHVMKVKGAATNTWHIPVPQQEQTEPFDTPPRTKEEF